MSVLDRFVRQRTVLLTTYRRDGSPVGTPVNIVVDGAHAYFRTYDRAWKCRRLANRPEVEVAPSTVRGRPTGPPARGRARLLDARESEPVRLLLRRKYPLIHGVAVPLAHRIRGYRTLHYELTLDDT
jgi:uncharacterized protein